MRQKLLILLAALMLVVAACGAEETAGADGDEDLLTVVATTTIWGDIVSQVTGDAANVEVVMPVGADPHDFQASSAQVEAMANADLVVVNGLQLEEGLLDVIETLEADGVNVLEIAALLDPIPFGEGGHDHHDHEGEEGHSDEDHDHEGEEGSKDEDHDHEGEEGHSDEDHDHEGEEGSKDEDHDHEGEEGHSDEDHDGEEGHDHEGEEGSKDEDHDHEGEEGHDDHGHDHGDEDPHVWHDPLRVAAAAELIAQELAALDPNGPWAANAEAYAAELRALDTEVIEILEVVPEDRRKMVTNHDAFGYFADRYDFEVVGTVIPSISTLAEPSSSDLAELVETMEKENIDVIFTETIEPATLAEAVAAESGTDVAVVPLFTGSLGELPPPDPTSGETYVDMIRTNATRIAGALS